MVFVKYFLCFCIKTLPTGAINMDYIDFCGENVSQFVLGTDTFFKKPDKNTAYEIMDLYTENGGNVIDLSAHAETLVGEYIKERGIRERLFIMTKCDFGDIEEAIDKSLARLGLDIIDMVFLHCDNEKRSVQNITNALNNMVQKGKIRYFGALGWTYDRIDIANRYAYESGQDGFCASQIIYNMATKAFPWDDSLICMEEDEKKKYENGSLPVFACSAGAKGFFEKYDSGILPIKAKEYYLTNESVKTYVTIKKRAQETGDTVSHTALKMLIEQSRFDVLPIIGASSVYQLKDSLNIK